VRNSDKDYEKSRCITDDNVGGDVVFTL
jgi:hypothetical protein